MTKYRAGDVLEDKANQNINVVILFPLRIKWRGYQRYRVRFYNKGEFNTGVAYEQELVGKV